MCDTFVALGNVTADGRVMFAKNSGREPNEAQWLAYYPPAEHRRGSPLTCTYVEIPQVRRTYGVLLSKPFWMWGGEMGINEHGVAIGNEAVRTKEPYDKQGLLGIPTSSSTTTPSSSPIPGRRGFWRRQGVTGRR